MKPETSALLGQQVGNIRVVDVLGEGGMGAVYVGFDDKLQRKVALKAIRAEYRLHEEAKARFLREARILSQLDHPHICTVHDFIEGDDCDFLVLELVKGKSLRHSMKEELSYQQKLSIAKQLLEVLVAVHGQGVVHRDLKPENVMVTEDGGIKVLDFGLSRSVEEESVVASTMPTLGLDEAVSAADLEATVGPASESRSTYVKTKLGTVIGTVGYMSPEQARAEPATAASDMYSLGLILQELFTGEPPFEQGLEPAELLKRAAEGDTLPVTGLSVEGRAFIERLKSQAPGARPSSVDALAGLERIIDRPRRRLRRVAAAAAVCVLAVFAIVVSYLLVRVSREVKRADREAETAKQVSEFLQSIFQVSDPSEARGNTITAREILDRGAERIEHELASEPLVKAELMHVIGGVYRALGLFELAGPVLRKALALRRQTLGDEHNDVARSLNRLASLLVDTGDYDEAETQYRESLAIQRRLFGDEDRHVAATLNNLAVVLSAKGDYDGAEAAPREGLAMQRRLVGDDTPDVAQLVNSLAGVLMRKGDYDGAEPLFRETLAVRRRLLGDDHPDVAMSLSNLAVALFWKGDYDAAEPLYREALAVYRHVFGNDHPRVATTLDLLASLLLDKGDLAEAESLYGEALEMSRHLLGDAHPAVAANLGTLATLLNGRGDYAEAESLAREAVEIYRRALPDGHWRTALQECVLGASLTGLGRPAEAERLLVGNLSIVKKAKGETSPDARELLRRIVELYEAWNKPDDAAEYRRLWQAAETAAAEELEARVEAAKADQGEGEGGY